MNQNLRVILNCIAAAIAGFIIINLISFGFDVIQNGLGENWSLNYKQGVFYTNGEPSGAILGSSRGNRIMLIFFAVSLYRNYKNGSFTLGKK